MKPSEIPIQQIISRVKHLEIRARKLVTDTLSSEYHSVFRGRGIEFHEVRNYTPEDDVRDIDWNVTARMREPYIKTYIEERQLTVIFAVDVSASSAFGGLKSKREMMAEIVALLGFASFFNNDRAGLVLFTRDIEKIVPPRKNYSHLLRIIRDTWYAEPRERGTSLSVSLRNIRRMLKKKAIIFLLSDFLDTDYERELLALSRKHEVIPIVVHDGLETGLALPPGVFRGPPVLFDLEDMETGAVRTLQVTESADSELKNLRLYYRSVFKKMGLDHTEADNQSDYFRTIELLLRRRLKSRAGVH